MLSYLATAAAWGWYLVPAVITPMLCYELWVVAQLPASREGGLHRRTIKDLQNRAENAYRNDQPMSLPLAKRLQAQLIDLSMKYGALSRGMRMKDKNPGLYRDAYTVEMMLATDLSSLNEPYEHIFRMLRRYDDAVIAIEKFEAEQSVLVKIWHCITFFKSQVYFDHLKQKARFAWTTLTFTREQLFFAYLTTMLVFYNVVKMFRKNGRFPVAPKTNLEARGLGYDPNIKNPEYSRLARVAFVNAASDDVAQANANLFGATIDEDMRVVHKLVGIGSVVLAVSRQAKIASAVADARAVVSAGCSFVELLDMLSKWWNDNGDEEFGDFVHADDLMTDAAVEVEVMKIVWWKPSTWKPPKNKLLLAIWTLVQRVPYRAMAVSGFAGFLLALLYLSYVPDRAMRAAYVANAGKRADKAETRKGKNKGSDHKKRITVRNTGKRWVVMYDGVELDEDADLFHLDPRSGRYRKQSVAEFVAELEEHNREIEDQLDRAFEDSEDNPDSALANARSHKKLGKRAKRTLQKQYDLGTFKFSDFESRVFPRGVSVVLVVEADGDEEEKVITVTPPSPEDKAEQKDSTTVELKAVQSTEKAASAATSIVGSLVNTIVDAAVEVVEARKEPVSDKKAARKRKGKKQQQEQRVNTAQDLVPARYHCINLTTDVGGEGQACLVFGKIYTAAHNLKDATKYSLAVHDAMGKKTAEYLEQPITDFTVHAGYDLAVAEMPKAWSGLKSYTVCTDLEIMEPLTIMCYIDGSTRFNAGTVTRIQGGDAFTNYNSVPGWSGAPVINGQGKLVGIHVAKAENSKENVMIPIDEKLATIMKTFRTGSA